MFAPLALRGGGVSSLSFSENLHSRSNLRRRAVLSSFGLRFRQDLLGVPSARSRFREVSGDKNCGATLHSDGRVGL